MLGHWVVLPIDPATHCIILKIVGFLDCKIANWAAPDQLTIPLNKLPCYDSSSNNCDVIRSLTPVGNDCQQGGQECSSQCTTTQEQECNTEYEQVCRNINEQVSTI